MVILFFSYIFFSPLKNQTCFLLQKRTKNLVYKKLKNSTFFLQNCTISDVGILNEHFSLLILKIFKTSEVHKCNKKNGTLLQLSYFTCRMSCITCHVSHVKCHVTWKFVSCHMSHVTCDM